jgi:hypothetical protein
MTTKLKFEFERGPFILPDVQDVAVYSGSKTIRLALSVEDDAGLPTIVFVPIPRAMLPDLIQALTSTI